MYSLKQNGENREDNENNKLYKSSSYDTCEESFKIAGYERESSYMNDREDVESE